MSANDYRGRGDEGEGVRPRLMVGDYHDLADIVPQVRGGRVFETNARAAGPDGTTTGVCDEASWTWRCVRAAAWIAVARFVSSWRVQPCQRATGSFRDGF